MLRNEKGITLVALVITVIMMLILAGVAISAVTDNGGLFDKVTTATGEYEKAMRDEAELYNTILNGIDEYFEHKVNDNTYAKITTPYVGTSACTVNINTNMSTENTKEFVIYVDGEENSRTTNLEYTIENLSPETTYNISVVAYDLNDNVYETNTKTITTRERVYLYNSGDECTTLTGGWIGVGVTDIKSNQGASYAAVAPTVTKNENNIFCRHSNSAMSSGSLSTTNKIDLSGYKKVVADTSITCGKSYLYSMIAIADNTEYYSNSARCEIVYTSGSAITKPREIFFADISNINEEMYIAFNYMKCTTLSSYAETYLYNVWLEY